MWATHVTYQPIHPVHWDKRDLEIGLWNAIWWIWQRRILFSQIVTLRLLVCITDSEVLTNWSNKSDKSTDLSGPMKIRLKMNWIWQGRMLSVIKINDNRPNKVIDQTPTKCVCMQTYHVFECLRQRQIQIQRQHTRQRQRQIQIVCCPRMALRSKCVSIQAPGPAPGRLLSTLQWPPPILPNANTCYFVMRT